MSITNLVLSPFHSASCLCNGWVHLPPLLLRTLILPSFTFIISSGSIRITFSPPVSAMVLSSLDVKIIWSTSMHLILPLSDLPTGQYNCMNSSTQYESEEERNSSWNSGNCSKQEACNDSLGACLKTYFHYWSWRISGRTPVMSWDLNKVCLTEQKSWRKRILSARILQEIRTFFTILMILDYYHNN